MKVSYRETNLPFTHPFTISRGTKTHQPSFIVELELGRFKGYGEAPAISYYDITTAQMAADLESKRPFVEKFALTDPERYWHYLHHLFPKNPFLVCALDMAGWDLWGQMKGKPLYELWDTPFTGSEPATDYTLGIDTVDKMLDKMKELPWPIYKIKLGSADDIEIVNAIKRHSTSALRVDANSGWTTKEAVEKIKVFAGLGVELIEQPLERANAEGMQVLFEKSPLPLIADESCVSEADVASCANSFHGINIKLTKCSGITPARRMIKAARELGLKVMMGSMNESSIGSAAIAHFLPQLDFVDADGPLLLAEDLATGLKYDFGKLSVSNRPGLGINVNPALFA